MLDKPQMTPRPNKLSGDWYVWIEWPRKRAPVQLNGFTTEEEAALWIKDESSDWLERHG